MVSSENAPQDFLNFGRGLEFAPDCVLDFLELRQANALRSVPVAMAPLTHAQLKEIAGIIDLVAARFDGDADKSRAWFKARNPLLGDLSPRDMIRFGRHDRLRRFVIDAIAVGA